MRSTEADRENPLTEVEARALAHARLEATVAALREPASYPPGVQHVEAIETHMSWVFLTEAHAYKLKKPIRTPAFDHTTIEARQRACTTELELNRRLASDVYLAVVALVATETGMCIEGAGTPIDWLVKMRRLPREHMLDARIERGAVRNADVDRLAAVLTRFYATTERYPVTGAAHRERIAADIESKCISLCQPHYGLSRVDIDAVLVRQRRWLASHGALLEARGASVVDAHGDLRPEHVCFENSTLVVIDCLEFDRTLRLLDPVSELAFLALECRRLKAVWIGERLLARYAELAGDPVPKPLFRFYQGHHALIRAVIAVWHLDDDALDQSARWRARGSEYLQIARKLLGAISPR